MISLQQKRAWVFDLDGTLTRPVHDFTYIRRSLGIPQDTDILNYISQQPCEIQCTLNAHLDELETHYAAQAQPAEGVIECLNYLKAQQCRLGILTRNTKELAMLSINAIGAEAFFQAEDVLGREDIKPKPAPDGINMLLNQWNEKSEAGVMVGDFLFDLLSGRAAGVLTVHTDERDRHWPEVTDFRVKDLRELISLFKS